MGSRWGNSGNSVRLYFLGGSKITADDDCCHEIKRCLLLGRNVMTNLDSYSKAETLLYQQRSVQSRLFFQWHPTPVLLPGKFHGMEEPGGLYTVHGVAKSRARLSDFTFTFLHWRRKWQPTPVFLPGESQGRGAWWAAVYGVAQSRTRLKRLSSSSISQSKPFIFIRNTYSAFGVHRIYSWKSKFTYACCYVT